MSHTITTGQASSVNFRRQGEFTDSDGTPLGDHPTNSAGGYGKNPGELGTAVVATTIDFHVDSKV